MKDKDIEKMIRELVAADRRAGFEGWSPLNPSDFEGRKPRARERRLPPTPHPWGFVGEEVGTQH